MSSKRKEKVEVEASLSLEDALAKITAIVEGLRTGALSLRRGNQGVTLSPEGLLETEIKAKVKGKKQSLEISLEWEAQTDGVLKVHQADGEPDGEAGAQGPTDEAALDANDADGDDTASVPEVTLNAEDAPTQDDLDDLGDLDADADGAPDVDVDDGDPDPDPKASDEAASADVTEQGVSDQQLRTLLETLSRNALRDKAQQLGLPGRSSWTKAQLVEGIASTAPAETLFTRDELYAWATEQDIDGRSRMGKEELLAAIVGRPSS